MTSPGSEQLAAKPDPSYRDLAGIAVAALCAIHCAATPLLLATVAASSLAWLSEERLEWGFVAASAAIGFASLIPAYRVHRKKACLLLFGAGLGTILVGRIAETGLPDTPFIVFGAALIVAAHVANRLFCRSCERCATQ